MKIIAKLFPLLLAKSVVNSLCRLKFLEDFRVKRTTKKTRPAGKTWKTARLFDVSLYDSRLPVCGQRYLWVVVGRKWVRACTPIDNMKFRMTRAVWNAISYRKEIA